MGDSDYGPAATANAQQQPHVTLRGTSRAEVSAARRAVERQQLEQFAQQHRELVKCTLERAQLLECGVPLAAEVYLEAAVAAASSGNADDDFWSAVLPAVHGSPPLPPDETTQEEQEGDALQEDTQQQQLHSEQHQQQQSFRKDCDACSSCCTSCDSCNSSSSSCDSCSSSSSCDSCKSSSSSSSCDSCKSSSSSSASCYSYSSSSTSCDSCSSSSVSDSGSSSSTSVDDSDGSGSSLGNGSFTTFARWVASGRFFDAGRRRTEHPSPEKQPPAVAAASTPSAETSAGTAAATAPSRGARAGVAAVPGQSQCQNSASAAVAAGAEPREVAVSGAGENIATCTEESAVAAKSETDTAQGTVAADAATVFAVDNSEDHAIQLDTEGASVADAGSVVAVGSEDQGRQLDAWLLSWKPTEARDGTLTKTPTCVATHAAGVRCCVLADGSPRGQKRVVTEDIPGESPALPQGGERVLPTVDESYVGRPLSEAATAAVSDVVVAEALGDATGSATGEKDAAQTQSRMEVFQRSKEGVLGVAADEGSAPRSPNLQHFKTSQQAAQHVAAGRTNQTAVEPKTAESSSVSACVDTALDESTAKDAGGTRTPAGADPKIGMGIGKQRTGGEAATAAAGNGRAAADNARAASQGRMWWHSLFVRPGATAVSGSPSRGRRKSSFDKASPAAVGTAQQRQKVTLSVTPTDACTSQPQRQQVAAKAVTAVTTRKREDAVDVTRGENDSDGDTAAENTLPIPCTTKEQQEVWKDPAAGNRFSPTPVECTSHSPALSAAPAGSAPFTKTSVISTVGISTHFPSPVTTYSAPPSSFAAVSSPAASTSELFCSSNEEVTEGAGASTARHAASAAISSAFLPASMEDEATSWSDVGLLALDDQHLETVFEELLLPAATTTTAPSSSSSTRDAAAIPSAGHSEATAFKPSSAYTTRGGAPNAAGDVTPGAIRGASRNTVDASSSSVTSFSLSSLFASPLVADSGASAAATTVPNAAIADAATAGALSTFCAAGGTSFLSGGGNIGGTAKEKSAGETGSSEDEETTENQQESQARGENDEEGGESNEGGGIGAAIREKSLQLQQHLQKLHEGLRNRDMATVRVAVADIAELGGPELSGVWAGVKVGMGIATVAAGHAVVGGLMLAMATGAVGSAVLWGRNREYFRSWVVGEQPTGEEEAAVTDEGTRDILQEQPTIDPATVSDRAANSESHVTGTSEAEAAAHPVGESSEPVDRVMQPAAADTSTAAGVFVAYTRVSHAATSAAGGGKSAATADSGPTADEGSDGPNPSFGEDGDTVTNEDLVAAAAPADADNSRQTTTNDALSVQ